MIGSNTYARIFYKKANLLVFFERIAEFYFPLTGIFYGVAQEVVENLSYSFRIGPDNNIRVLNPIVELKF